MGSAWGQPGVNVHRPTLPFSAAIDADVRAASAADRPTTIDADVRAASAADVCSGNTLGFGSRPSTRD
jgi:hypothetical protein